MVTSAHEDQTCAVASQSYRNPSTYFPGAVAAGMERVSTIETPTGNLPEQLPESSFRDLSLSPHGGLNCIGIDAVPNGRGLTAHIDPGGDVPWVRYLPVLGNEWCDK